MKLGVGEILIILAVALVIFGGTKIKGVGKALGQSIREFKEEVGTSKNSKENRDTTEKSDSESTNDK